MPIIKVKNGWKTSATSNTVYKKKVACEAALKLEKAQKSSK